jgi:hypothetical protein
LNESEPARVYDAAICFAFFMDDLPLGAKILKSLIAPARHSDGSTLYLICQSADGTPCTIYEQLPNGTCLSWAEPAAKGVQQAEGLIYQQVG